MGAPAIREVKKDKKQVRGLINVSVIGSSVSAKWRLSKLGFHLPQRLGDRGPLLPYDYTSKEWLSSP